MFNPVKESRSRFASNLRQNLSVTHFVGLKHVPKMHQGKTLAFLLDTVKLKRSWVLWDIRNNFAIFFSVASFPDFRSYSGLGRI